MLGEHPGSRVEGLPVGLLQWEGGQTDPQHDIGLLLFSVGDVLAIAIATVADHNISGLQVEMGELFSTFAVSDPHLGHAASVQIVGQVRPPIIATAANLAQASGIKEQ